MSETVAICLTTVPLPNIRASAGQLSSRRQDKRRRRLEAHARADEPLVLIDRDPAAPPVIRLIARDGGPTAVMPSVWIDPEDLRPDARKRAREIKGHRGYCPLRRLLSQRHPVISREHVIAADILRLRADVGRLGYSGDPDAFMACVARMCGPRGGPSDACLAQVHALKDFLRAMKIFAPLDRRFAATRMVVSVLLSNWSVQRWCRSEAERTERRHDEKIELGKLTVLLDLLAAHYDSEIEASRQMGEVLLS